MEKKLQYDIIAISGNGNNSLINMFFCGLNAIMGVRNDEFYKKEYRNIKFPYRIKLNISDIKVKLIPKF